MQIFYINSECEVEKGPGRPKNTEIDGLKAKVWHHAIELRSGGKISDRTGAKEFPNKLRGEGAKHGSDRSWTRYGTGFTVPDVDRLINVNKVYEKTAIVALHPFWEVSSVPPPSLARIIKLLGRFRLDIRTIPSICFKMHVAATSVDLLLSTHVFDWKKILKSLDAQGDLDAVTGCLAIALIGMYQDNPMQHYCACQMALKIFIRVASLPPFFNYAEEIYDYLKVNVFPQSMYTDRTLATDGIQLPKFERDLFINRSDLDIRVETEYRLLAIFVLTRSGILEGDAQSIRAGLYLIDCYGPEKILPQLLEIYKTQNLAAANALPFSKWLKRRLKKTDVFYSILDPSTHPLGSSKPAE